MVTPGVQTGFEAQITTPGGQGGVYQISPGGHSGWTHGSVFISGNTRPAQIADSATLVSGAATGPAPPGGGCESPGTPAGGGDTTPSGSTAIGAPAPLLLFMRR